MKCASTSGATVSMQTIVLSPFGFQCDGRVLDEVVADRDHDVGVVEAGERVVARLTGRPCRAGAGPRRSSSPLPMNVSATPMPVARANSRSAGAAPTRSDAVAGEHDRVDRAADDLGRLAAAPARSARDGAASCGPAAARRRPWRAMTSSGSSMCVGPGFCACATLNALRTTSGMIRGLVSRAFHFVTGLNIETTSMYWWDSLCMRSRSPCPVSATSGERSRNASATAVIEVRRAGPERAQADARALGEPPVHVGHVRTALLVADGDEGDARALQRLVEIQRLLARDAEDVLDALGLEALDEEIRRLAFAHPATSIPATCRANVRDRSRRRFPVMHRILRPILLALLGCLVCAARASAASRLTIRGAGFGHGVGMSQYGAMGFAKQGTGYREILGHYYTGTSARHGSSTNRTVRVLLQSTQRRRVVHRAPSAPARAGSTRPRATAWCAARSTRSTCRARAAGAIGTYTAPLRVDGGADGIVLKGRALNGRTSGAYRGVLELRPGAFGVNAINAVVARRLRPGRRARRVARLLAARGAQGPGGRRAHLRDHHLQGRRRLRALPRHPLAGLRRHRGRAGDDQPGGRADRAARS